MVGGPALDRWMRPWAACLPQGVQLLATPSIAALLYLFRSFLLPKPTEVPSALWENHQACKESLDEALGCVGDDRREVAGRVQAIGVSGQQHGMVALDAHKQVIRPGEGQPSSKAAAQQGRCPADRRARLLPSKNLPKYTVCMPACLAQRSCGVTWRALQKPTSCRGCGESPSSLPSQVGAVGQW